MNATINISYSLADSENQEKVLLYRICFVPLHYESFGIFDNKGLHQRSCRSRQAFARLVYESYESGLEVLF